MGISAFVQRSNDSTLQARQGEPHGIATRHSLGLDTAAYVAEVSIVLADDLAAHEVLGTLQTTVSIDIA